MNRPNFTIDEYMRMCRDGEAKWSLSEAARLMGVSRMYLHRCMMLSTVTEEEFEQVLDDFERRGKRTSLVALADEIKRRTGRSRRYVERCPHCGGHLRTRER